MNSCFRIGNSLTFIVFVLLLLAQVAGCEKKAAKETASQGNKAAVSEAAPKAAGPASSVGFASHKKLVEHFEKHGNEFGGITVQEYLKMAQELRDRPAGGNIREAVRQDGAVTRFDRGSGTFIAFNSDGVIRTFFKPADGEAYFVRQARRQK